MSRRRRIISTLLTIFALVASGAVFAPPASAATVGLVLTDGSPLVIPWTAHIWGVAWIGITNASPDTVQVVSVDVATTDPALSHFRAYMTSGIPNDGNIVAGGSFSIGIDLLINSTGTHLGTVTICDRAPAEPEGTTHCSDDPVQVVVTPFGAATMTLTGPESAPPGSVVTLSGTVIDEIPSGGVPPFAPIAGGTVELTRDAGSGAAPLPSVVTDASGTFTFDSTVGAVDTVFTASFSDADHSPGTVSWTVHPVKSVSTVTVVAPATGVRGATYPVTGVLTSGGSAVASALVTVSRKDLSGTRQFTASTDAAGAYAFTDKPAVGGPVTFTVSWAGDDSRSAATRSRTVTIARTATAMTIAASRSTFAYAAKATITVHLGTTYNSRTVTVYARPLGTTVTAPGTRIASGRVNSSGNLVVTYTMTRRTVITAVFTGDYRYAPASRAVTPNVVSRVTLTMTGYSGTSGGAYLYRHGTSVYFQSTVLPGRPGGCEAFVAQRYSSGRWVTVTTTSCGHLDGRSTAHMYFVSSAPRGTKYRVRGSVGSGSYSLGGTSPWRYFTYT